MSSWVGQDLAAHILGMDIAELLIRAERSTSKPFMQTGGLGHTRLVRPFLGVHRHTGAGRESRPAAMGSRKPPMRLPSGSANGDLEGVLEPPSGRLQTGFLTPYTHIEYCRRGGRGQSCFLLK
jgi:hypothetical protein